MTSRRKFLQQTATSGLAAALSAFPPSIRRALAIPAFHETGTIQDVKHVVLLMMENRAFDSYFGTFKGVRGYGDRFAVPSLNGRDVFYQTYTKATPATTVTPYHLDANQGNAQRAGGTPHTWADAQAAWDHGRMNRWPDAKTPLSMGYYDAAEVPFQRALADAFTLCDHYHCGMHTGTIANRLFYWSGTNGPNGISPADGSRVKIAALNNQFNGGNDIGPSSQGWTWTTYADRLQQAGVKWKVYQSLIDNFGCNEMMSFRHWRAAIEQMPPARRPAYVASTDITQPVTAAGAFYDPAIDDALARSRRVRQHDAVRLPRIVARRHPQRRAARGVVDHPAVRVQRTSGAVEPAQGGWYVQAVLDALTANPEVWSKTVLLVNYDENDGFFDHMPSPAVPSRNADGTLAGGHTLRDADVAAEYHDFTPATSSQPATDGRPYGPPARADVGRVAVEPRRLGQLAGVRPYVDAALPRTALRRRGAADQRVSPRGVRRPDERVQLPLAEPRTAADARGPYDEKPGRRAERRATGRAEDRAVGRAVAARPGERRAPVARAALRTACQRACRCRHRHGHAEVREHGPRRRRVSRL